PNPTVSYLKLELHNTQQQPFNVALIDLAGHIVDVKMVNSLGSYEEVVFDVSALKSGIYIYRIFDSSSQFTGRFIKN
ncbi:MAG: T9SS type A sorting domain-containing protein, partial [Cyclobacteriaceae bacterium]